MSLRAQSLCKLLQVMERLSFVWMTQKQCIRGYAMFSV